MSWRVLGPRVALPPCAVRERSRRHRAARDLLLRRNPPLVAGAPLRQPGESTVLCARRVALGERVELGAVPVTNVLRTLPDCVEAHVSPEFIEVAARQARARGLLDKDDVEAIRARWRAA